MGVCVSSTAPSSSQQQQQQQQQHHQLEGNGEEQSRKKHTLSASRRTSGSYNNGGGAVVSLQHTNSSSSHQNTECFSSSCHLSGGAPDNDSNNNNNNNTGNTHHRQGNSKESLRCVTHPEDDADDDDDKGGVGVGVRTTAFLQGTPAHAHTHTDMHHQCSSKSHNVFPQDRVDPPITMTAVDGSLLVAEYSLRGGDDGGRGGRSVGEGDREVSQAHHLAVSDKKISSEELSRQKDMPPSSTLQSRSGGCTGDGGCTSRRQRRAINPAAFKSIQDPHQTNAATGSVAGAGASSSSWPAHPLHQFQRAVTPVRDSMPSTVPAEAVVAPAAAHHFCEDAFGSPRPSVQFTEESTIPGGGGGGGQRDVLPFLLPPQQLVLPPAQGGACSTLDEGHSEERHVTVKTSHDEDCEGFIYPASPEAATPSPRQFRGVNNPLASPSAVVAGVTRTMIVATASGERRQRGGGVAFFHEEASLSTSAHRDMVVGAGGSTSGSAYPYCAYGGGGATTALLFAPLSSIPSANSEHFESFVSAPMLRSPATSSHAANRPRGW